MCRIFKYISKKENRSTIYLNGPDRADPKILFTLYVNWWNTEFAPEEELDPDGFEDYEYEEYFCPIDFYDDYNEFVRK